ncbi:MAG: hypothetical protein M3066_15895 [Actinomycetota bacterium]|nr:hypothetical protein [Actinomycetota bacterium]
MARRSDAHVPGVTGLDPAFLTALRRAETAAAGCSPMYANPTHDPRM